MSSSEQMRLAWRCRRGMLELDILLENFLRHGYAQLDEAGRESFLQLLDLQDQELLETLMLDRKPRKESWHELIRRIRNTAAA